MIIPPYTFVHIGSDHPSSISKINTVDTAILVIFIDRWIIWGFGSKTNPVFQKSLLEPKTRPENRFKNLSRLGPIFKWRSSYLVQQFIKWRRLVTNYPYVTNIKKSSPTSFSTTDLAFVIQRVCLVSTLVLTLFKPSFLEFFSQTGPNQFSLNRTQNHSNLIGKYWSLGHLVFKRKWWASKKLTLCLGLFISIQCLNIYQMVRT